MKIAMGQINPTVGDILGNVAKMSDYATEAGRHGADLIVFPELSLVGYPPKDLLDIDAFIESNLKALDELARQTVTTPAMLVGFVDRNHMKKGKRVFDAAALLHQGRVVFIQHKSLLPTYDVFDEARYFEPAAAISVFDFQDYRLGITICEDMWNDRDFWPEPLYPSDPVETLAQGGANLLINLSASPFAIGRQNLKWRMLKHTARKFRLPLLYINQVGGNDDIIFDGGSVALNDQAQLIAHAERFAEDLVIIDTARLTKTIPDASIHELEDVYKALVLGLRDYVRKCGFRKVVLGVSGGIDSALTAALAVAALGSENVLAVAMPSPYSSPGSTADAAVLAKNLGVECLTLPVTEIFQSYKNTLRPAFSGRGEDVTEENLQARIRGTLLMALSNKFGYLVLSTGNKSELATGYCTLYGDMSGGLAVISDVPKTMVYQLARYVNRNGELIPQASLTKPPSAELRPNQCDQDSLPPYDILDGILRMYIEELKSIGDIVAAGYARTMVEDVIRRVDANEYKRKQAAPGLRITSKAFGVGRRMPIAQKYSWRQGRPEST
ncbi:MAG: NAD+ synthase [Acidobacteria bacterium]|nr:NAD+ synthase [Acidobacteriota bacterium]